MAASSPYADKGPYTIATDVDSIDSKRQHSYHIVGKYRLVDGLLAPVLLRVANKREWDTHDKTSGHHFLCDGRTEDGQYAGMEYIKDKMNTANSSVKASVARLDYDPALNIAYWVLRLPPVTPPDAQADTKQFNEENKIHSRWILLWQIRVALNGGIWGNGDHIHGYMGKSELGPGMFPFDWPTGRTFINNTNPVDFVVPVDSLSDEEKRDMLEDAKHALLATYPPARSTHLDMYLGVPDSMYPMLWSPWDIITDLTDPAMQPKKKKKQKKKKPDSSNNSTCIVS